MATFVPKNTLSNTKQKRLAMHARLDEETDCYSVSAFLLAQFGKIFAVEQGHAVSGKALMDDVFPTAPDTPSGSRKNTGSCCGCSDLIL